MATSALLAAIDTAIEFVSFTVDAILCAEGYADQTFRQLVTKIDDNTSNESQIPMLGLGVKCISATHTNIPYSLTHTHTSQTDMVSQTRSSQKRRRVCIETRLSTH